MNLMARIHAALLLGVAILRHMGGQVGESAPAGQYTPDEVKQVLAAGLASCPDAVNYDTSVVDLFKVLHIDSTKANRKQMAEELGYPGSLEDSAAMNTWLHAEVMKNIAKYHPRPANA